MKALVTGATGFVGSHLVGRLLADGWEVRALTRDPEKSAALKDRGVALLPGDLADPPSLRGIAEGVDVVFNCAAQLNLPGATLRDYMATNVGGLRSLVDAVKESNPSLVRFVQISSIAAIGIRNLHDVDETCPCRPDLPYGVSKLRADEMLLGEARLGFPAVIVRPPTVYGPGERYNFLSLCRAIRSRRFLVIGSGRNRIDFCWVGNLVQAMAKAATRGAPGEVYLVADGQSLPFLESVSILSELLGSPLPRLRLPTALAYAASVPLAALASVTGAPPILYPKRVRTMTSDLAFDLARARSRLGYEPEGPFRELAARTIAWYRSEGLL